MSDDREPIDIENIKVPVANQAPAQTGNQRVRNTLLGVVGAIVLIAVLGGVGWFAFNAGSQSSGNSAAAVFALSSNTATQAGGGQAQPPGQAAGPVGAGAGAAAAAATTATTDLASAATLSTSAPAAAPAGGLQPGLGGPPPSGPAGSAPGFADASSAAIGQGAAVEAAVQPTVTINTQPNTLEQAAVRTTVATQPATVASIPVIVSTAATPLLSDEGVALARLANGDILRATARSADNQWLAVQNDSALGWVQRNALIAFGVSDLATASPPAAVAGAALPPAGHDESGAVALVTTGPDAATGAEAAPAAADAAAAPASAQPSGLEATVSSGAANLNVRAGPGTEYAVVAKAATGSALTLTARSDAADWLKVLLPSGESGWAAARYLNISGSVPSLPVETATAAPVQTAPAAGNAAAASGAAAASSAQSTNSAATAPVAAESLSGTLAFQQSPGGMIWTYDFATGATNSVTTGFDPAMSPDGSTIAFVREGGEAGLYLVNSDGTNERRIFGERGRLSAPKWSDDGQWILFGRGDEYYECYPMGQSECLTEDELARRFPKGTPPGMNLVLEKRYFDKLSVVDADGNNFHDIPSLTSAKAADWSNGKIVYQSSAGLFRTADGASDANQLIVFEPLMQQFQDPDLQPGGDEIAYQMKGAAQWDIWAVNSDGTNRHGLTKAVTTLVDALPSNVAPAYSPDGAHIVYLSNRADNNEAGDWRLWVMAADGSNAHPLPIAVPITYKFGAEQVVSWGG